MVEVASAGVASQVPKPILRLENLVKIPGSDIGFPSDERFVFNRIRTDLNPRNQGHRYAFNDRRTVRVHNDGDADLVIGQLDLSDHSAFAFRLRDFELLPITVKPGEHYDLEMIFVKADPFWKGATGNYFSDLIIGSNAGTKVATLAGHYQIRPEGAWEPSVRDISELFGFNCGVPEGHLCEAYPTPDSDRHYGEIVVSEYWEQADPAKPVRIMFLYALNGGGNPNLKFLDADGKIVGGVEIQVNGRRQINGETVWVCQTVFPWEEQRPDRVVGMSVDRIQAPFRLSISGRSTSGTGPIQPGTGKPESLALQFFRIKDERGRVRDPNVFMVIFDVVSINGSHANSDFNDYVLYISNIRPKDNRPEMDLTKW